jgi:hypothetical protein
MNVTTGGVTGMRRRVVEEARERGVARVGGHWQPDSEPPSSNPSVSVRYTDRDERKVDSKKEK